ncbi:MAG: alpha/beta fold hydrolase [Elusimicrobia bacterium]|nr:alpha/beta fold hydrolase [Elusimicrobiota bacterium]
MTTKTPSALPFKKTDPKVLEHAVERRGFVNAPLDHARPDGPSIPIFYRLIPAYGSRHDDPSHPVIVVINGGPGISCSAYRPLDFDYANPSSPKNGALDRFKYLLKSHRILLVDQRGTDGQSAPIDMTDPAIDADAISLGFSSDSQARDYLAVIETLIPKGEFFYIIAQSYGGMVGMQYLSLTLAGARKPKGIVFSASALPYEDVLAASLARRSEQRKLNLELREAYPDVEKRLAAVRAYLKSLGLNPDSINGLFGLLGKGVKGVWEKAFIAHLEKMLGQTRAEVEKDARDNFGEVNLLNYVLSSSNFTPGETDRTIAARTTELVPYEPWMIDENWVTMQAGGGVAWREAFVTAMDRRPPPATPFSSPEGLRAAIALNGVLFTPADNDAFVPADSYIRSLAKFEVEGHTRIKRLPGGHNAIFLEEGHRAFLEWAATLP